MYIESADLSEKHVEIKFIDNCKYLLKDCGSENGTWVRIKELDLYKESRTRVYKVKDYMFTIEESKLNFTLLIGQDYFDEVSSWLKSNNFSRYGELFKQKQILLLKEIP